MEYHMAAMAPDRHQVLFKGRKICLCGVGMRIAREVPGLHAKQRLFAVPEKQHSLLFFFSPELNSLFFLSVPVRQLITDFSDITCDQASPG